MKFVALLSSGIDSPVAVYLLARRGAEIVCLHFQNSSGDGVGVEKVGGMVRRLSEIVGKRIDLWAVPFQEVQDSFVECCNRRYQCLLCKRMMYRVAEAFARREGAEAIVTGESLGQVASQTIPNLAVLDAAVSIPVVRPLNILTFSSVA